MEINALGMGCGLIAWRWFGSAWRGPLVLAAAVLVPVLGSLMTMVAVLRHHLAQSETTQTTIVHRGG